jgi:23S rRNA (uracil1939-C5)-methyltransferase
LILTIEKLIYGGDGLARLPADDRGRGKAVFMPFVLAGEKVEATLTEQKPGFARARVASVVEASRYRIPPGCPHFGACGGCQYQHASYEHQLEIKKEILRETLRRMAKLELTCEIEVHPSPPWNYRNRSRLQVQTKPAFAAGYFRLASHALLPVEECPISSPLINRGIAALWQCGRAGQVPDGVREVEFFANATDTQLLLEISCTAGTRRASVKACADELRSLLPEIAGVVAFRDAQPGQRGVAWDEILLAHGEQHLTYQTQSASYRVSAGAFFQTNRHLSDELAKIVTQGRSGGLAFDLYAGVGLFSTALARDFRHIVSVESSQPAVSDLKYNLPSNGEAVQATAEEYLSGSSREGRSGTGAVLPQLHTPDLAVVDPPRSGLGERVARSLANLGAPRITYVSCDPATLARDLSSLLGAGYRVEQAHLVDLFPQTAHIETVLQLVL